MNSGTTTTEAATRRLSDFVANSRPGDLPEPVRLEARRALLNILGCALGGSRHQIVGLTREALREHWGPPQATLLGQREKTDILHAAYLNCVSSSVDSFDDSHAEAIIHPSGPVLSVLLALAERRETDGAAFLHAFALGIEVICRAAKAICVAPARGGIAWVQTPIVGGLGAAAAAGRLLGLDGVRMAWALGLAGSQAGGYRGNHGTMNMPLMPAQAARSGLFGALLAERGVTSSEATLEGRYGFCEVFSEEANPAALTRDLGEKYDLLGITYKPYPCGIVVNPTLEACLKLKERWAIESGAVEKVEIQANPTAAAIANRQSPKDPLAAQVSLQHWAACALAEGLATKAALDEAMIAAPRIAVLREKVEVNASPERAEDAAIVTVHLASGESHSETVEHCIGSAQRPMTDAELETKFRSLLDGIKSEREIDLLIELCWSVQDLDDVSEIARLSA